MHELTILCLVGTHSLGSQKVDDLVSTVDLFPTILEILDIDDANVSKLPGKNLTKELDREFVLSEARFKQGFAQVLVSVRENPDIDQRVFGGAWKSVQSTKYDYVTSPLQELLYDLELDPQEKQDISQENPQIVNQYHSHMIVLTQVVM